MRATTLAASLISAGLATLITAHLAEKRLLQEFDERLERELAASVDFLEETGKAKVKTDYKEKRAEKVVSPTLSAPAAGNQSVRYDNVIKTNGYLSDETPPDDEALERIELGNIVSISTDEFMENECGFLQSTLTYYADGGVLDEHNDVVIAFEDLIGNARPPFGHLSGEPHVCYLRNVGLRREFEVIEDDARAEDVVAGNMP